MKIAIYSSKKESGKNAALIAASKIKAAIQENGNANIILATGASQFDMLEHLVADDQINWDKVAMFHLDEYIGLPQDHPASFRKYLKERFVENAPGLKAAYFIRGDSEDPEKECERLNNIISEHSIDVAMVGIGENGHLAFNDPPADFDTETPFIMVKLDEKARKQQVGEGWFDSLEKVPQKAISMSVKQILKSKTIICTVPDERKAEAVKKTVEGEVNNNVPASILQKHPDCYLVLDEAAASQLSIPNC